MKIAVTGASGFIGRHVVAELRRRSIHCVAVVHRDSKKNREICSDVVPLDIHNPPPNAFEAIGSPDIVIHLAWSGLPNYRSLHHIETELPRQYLFLSGLIHSGLSSLLVTGTCFEYGMQSGSLTEACGARPENPYGFAKDTLRRQLQFLGENHTFNLTWARLFYLYGEGQSENSLWQQLQQAVGRGDACFPMSGGEQLRDYLPVEEAARIIVALAIKKVNAGVVNVCSGEPISVRRLVEKWIVKNGWKIELNLGHFPYPDYEPMAFWGDKKRLVQLLEKHEQSN